MTVGQDVLSHHYWPRFTITTCVLRKQLISDHCFMTNRASAFYSLVAAAIVFSVLPYVPFGSMVMRPFQLLTTYVHELGHGLAAIAQGGTFIKLEVFTNGGGVATTSGVSPGVGRAITAAGGLLAPSIAGGLFILSGRSRKSASVIFLGFTVLMLVSCVLWIRTPFAWALVGGLGLLFLYFGVKSGAGVHQFLIQFFAVHMFMDTLTGTMSYLFSATANKGNSDTANIAENLGGTYWMWGLVIAAIALLIFYLSFRRAYLR